MEQGRGRGNPWNRGRGGGDGRLRGHQKVERKAQDSSNKPNNITSESKFQQAKAQQQAAIQKHINKDYESSSEEEELESDNILGMVLKSYAQLGGKNEDLGRTQRFLEDVFQSGAASCLICIATVKRNDAIWSCIECFCFFHLPCIQRWSKDSIAHQKQALEDLPRPHSTKFVWSCPKCRHDYDQDDTPQYYYCFCGRQRDPEFHPWQVPHSCGETCGRQLQPKCGHDCLLLCHPGPCPPCPKTVRTKCFCGQQPAKVQRCSNKTWSCGKTCSKLLLCGQHKCEEVCHPGDCSACPRTSSQYCECKSNKCQRPCASPKWNCDKVCNKPLSCGNHKCEKICHSGECGACPLTELRFCPCGKTSYQLPCTQITPTCGDTCGRPLECGSHTCSQPCHRDKCGSCLEVVTKVCRCGSRSKEQLCGKEYLCDIKCKRIRDCLKHPCNRKCCDGQCPPCEKPCNRTLTCGNHKCSSVCHRGPCYPCPLTADVKCSCGDTVLVVPCGRKKKTKPPRCSQPCRNKPDCHHPTREKHRCHFGECPPCKQTCNKPHENCDHLCPAPCHTAVWVKVESNHKPAGPWEVVLPQLEKKNLPCPPCKVPLPVTCLGGHETTDWPCYVANPTSCQRPCGRLLKCGNHTCSLSCHAVENEVSEHEAGSNCEQCEMGCSKPRPDGCTHSCLRPCHPEDCAPCKQMSKIRCHCQLNLLYVQCAEWTSADKETREKLQNCGNKCPKNYPCGHRCQANCHEGECPDPELCRKKVKLYCPCKHIKKEIPCDVVRAGANVDCDDSCKSMKEKKNEEERERKRLQQIEEDRKNQEELLKFQKKFGGKKKHKERKNEINAEQKSLLSRYWVFGVSGLAGILVAVYFLFEVGGS